VLLDEFPRDRRHLFPESGRHEQERRLVGCAYVRGWCLILGRGRRNRIVAR
jgi:hypothetical protein